MSKENRISCPFCGGEMVRPFNTSHFMRCTNCGAQSPFTHNFTDVEREARKRADRPKGEWTENGVADRCSNCQKSIDVLQSDMELNYCPNCGAEMDDESGTNNNDVVFFPAIDGYVLRSKVISTLYHSGYKKAASLCKAIAVIEQPTSVPKGEWYKPKGMMPPEHAGRYRCSNCDEFAPCDWKTLREVLARFCPNCGSKMEVLK